MAVMGNSFTIHPVTDYWWGEWAWLQRAATVTIAIYCSSSSHSGKMVTSLK